MTGITLASSSFKISIKYKGLKAESCEATFTYVATGGPASTWEKRRHLDTEEPEKKRSAKTEEKTKSNDLVLGFFAVSLFDCR